MAATLPRTGTIARGIAAEALAMRLSDLDPAVIGKARLCLMDYLACALEARHLPWSRQAMSVVAAGGGPAGLIAQGRMASPADAAFANGVAGHGLVREDMHAGSIAHLGVVVWPALLACAARQRVDGERLLTAAIVGYEVGARLGRALMDADLARLFRPTGLVGAPAAAVALARMCGLGEAGATNAFALACNSVAGLNQWPHNGGSEMYFHPGFAARNAVTAFDLAAAGAHASPDIVEGEAGMFAAYARRAAPARLTLFPDGQAEIASVFNKEAPACNFAQTPCQVALRAIGRIGASRRISQVELRVTSAASRYPGCNATGPFANALQAKMSIYFGVAATLARGEIAEASYSRLDDPEIARLVSLTEMVADPKLTAAFPERQGAAIRVRLDDGTVVEESLDDVLPASPTLIRARFRSSASAAWGDRNAQTLAAMIEELETLADVAQIDAMSARRAADAQSTS